MGDTPGRNEPGTGEINFRVVLQHVSDKWYSGFVGLEHGTSNPGKAGELSTLEAYRSVDPGKRKITDEIYGVTSGVLSVQSNRVH